MPKNVFDRQLESPPQERQRTLHPSDIIPGTIQPRHMSANLHTIKFGLSANRPDGSTDIKAWFSTDTGVLSLWSGSAWLSVTLS